MLFGLEISLELVMLLKQAWMSMLLRDELTSMPHRQLLLKIDQFRDRDNSNANASSIIVALLFLLNNSTMKEPLI